MTKKTISLLLALCMIFALAACSSSNKGQGSGTEEDPWICGNTADDDVRVYIVESSLIVDGDGEMKNYDDPADRPWHKQIGDISDISIFGALKYIGKNAFNGAGANLGDEYVYLFLSDGIEAIGESAFEDVKFSFDSDDFHFSEIITIPESVVRIDASAFANSHPDEIYINGAPEVIESAFEGNTSTVYVRNGSGFECLPYGGELTYKTLYAFNYEDDYGTDEITGAGTEYIPEGETATYDANSYISDESYVFDHYEVVSGDIQIADPANPELSFVITGDVSIKIVYVKAAE